MKTAIHHKCPDCGHISRIPIDESAEAEREPIPASLIMPEKWPPADFCARPIVTYAGQALEGPSRC